MIDCACLIASTDSFVDVWPPALECLRRYWPDRPWPVFTLSNFTPWGEQPVMVGEDKGWCRNVARGLELVNAEFVMLWLEDMLLCEPVQTEYLVASLDALKADPNLAAVRVGPGPETYEPIRNTVFCRVMKTSGYRCNTSPTIWRASYLRDMLGAGNTAWEFEINGSKRSAARDEEIWKVNLLPPPVQLVFTMVTRGQFEEGALDWLQRVGISVDASKRAVKGYEKGQRWPKT